MRETRQIKEIVGENIATIRADAGLSRRAFGEALGVDQMLVYKWERAEHRPNDENMAALALFAGRDVSWFFTDHDRAAA